MEISRFCSEVEFRSVFNLLVVSSNVSWPPVVHVLENIRSNHDNPADKENDEGYGEVPVSSGSSLRLASREKFADGQRVEHGADCERDQEQEAKTLLIIQEKYSGINWVPVGCSALQIVQLNIFQYTVFINS